MAKLTAGLLGYTQGAIAGVQAQKLRGEIILRKKQPSIPTKTEAQRVYRSRWGAWQRLMLSIKEESSLTTGSWATTTNDYKKTLFSLNTRASAFVDTDLTAWRQSALTPTGEAAIYLDSDTGEIYFGWNYAFMELEIGFNNGAVKVFWADGSTTTRPVTDFAAGIADISLASNGMPTDKTMIGLIADVRLANQTGEMSNGIQRFAMIKGASGNSATAL